MRRMILERVKRYILYTYISGKLHEYRYFLNDDEFLNRHIFYILDSDTET